MSAHDLPPGGGINADHDEIKEIADADFEPWSAESIENMNHDFSAASWCLAVDGDVGISLRMSAAILGKSKGELAKIGESLGDAAFEMLDALAGSSRFLKQLVEIIDAAHTRQIVGMSVAATKKGGAA